jgi:1-acyl-sn-glycerol-3-phosphate acyltransferase
MLFLPMTLLFLLAGFGINLILSGNNRLRAKFNAFSTMFWAKAMCAIFGVRVVLSGADIMAGGFTVCNHMSYLDIFAIGSVRPSAFLSNHEVRGWPIIGWLALLGGTVFVNRQSKRAALEAIREIESKIDAGIAVVVFPEGTTSNGRSMRTFKSTFFNVPAGKDIPLIPVSIRYSPDMQDELAWYGGMKLAPHFWKVIGYRKIRVFIHFNPPILRPAGIVASAELRKKLCSLAHESVVAGFNACGTMDR